MLENVFGFHGPLAELLTGFVYDKRAFGCAYSGATLARVRHLDAHFSGVGKRKPRPDEFWGKRFLAHRPGEAHQSTLQRVYLWRQFASFCRRQGIEAWIPEPQSLPLCPRDFCPYIFTRMELRALFDAIDALPHPGWYSRRTVDYALLFRLLYGAGLRISEGLAVTIGDYEIETGTLRIRQGKNRKDRFVPLTESLRRRMEDYLRHHLRPDADAHIFLSPIYPDRQRGHSGIRSVFNEKILPAAGLPPRRNGKGPRIHDLRHTFAVHRLENWFLANEDVEAKLPILAAYMGHVSIYSTYYYLRITQSFFPEIARRLQREIGDIIPRLPEDS
jgi:integrase